MMSIHALNQLIPVYSSPIVTVNMLSTGDIHYGYSDIVAKLQIAEKHLRILLEDSSGKTTS
ncbi:MAG: hypothetical protein ACTS73_05385 [Arsenophonus sp. NEOnobi-MAG3]